MTKYKSGKIQKNVTNENAKKYKWNRTQIEQNA